MEENNSRVSKLSLDTVIQILNLVDSEFIVNVSFEGDGDEDEG